MIDKDRWHEVSESHFPHEREGLQALRQACQPGVVLQAWTNFEFLDEQGRLYEVDALLLTRYGLTLVELKHYRGLIAVDELNWIRKPYPNGPTSNERSPLPNANHKCKVLASYIRNSIGRSPHRLSVEALIFLSHPDVQFEFLEPSRLQPICNSRTLEEKINAPLGFQREALTIDFQSQIIKSLEKLGIRKTPKRPLMVGDYLIKELLGDGEHYQDHLAESIHLTTQKLRIRTFVGRTPADRERADNTAKREFQQLKDLSHDYILVPKEYKVWEQGPALLYQYYDKAEPLDLLDCGPAGPLSFAEKLKIWGQLGEAIRYAHRLGKFHRSLSPQNILVLRQSDNQGEPLQIKVINWQTVSAAGKTAGTIHVTRWTEERFGSYLAPEMIDSPNDADETVDLFSIGGIGYYLFSGQSPAANQSELQTRLFQHQGLNLLSVVDQAQPALVELIKNLTQANPGNRIQTAAEFLQQLAEIERQYCNPVPVDEPTVDPMSARPGDLILPGYQLVRKLGHGSSSVAFLVSPVKADGAASSGENLVLKVPLPGKSATALEQEAEVLKLLDHKNIVKLRSIERLGDKTALLLTSAGESTLAERLAKEGVLGLELLHRFGCDLLEACEYLQQVGIAHRDLKPANLGVRKVGKNEELHLCLFDFSLSREDRRTVLAGTASYRDPFLHAANRPWDEFAERYAAAVTLYECASGRTPQWGDGKANPAVVNVEVSFQPSDFEPGMRDSFEKFFRKAFQREASLRHETAEEMLADWKQVFQQASLDDSSWLTSLPEQVPSETRLSELVSNPQLDQIFTRLNLTTAGTLMGISRYTLMRLSNVGAATRNQLRLLYDALKHRLEGDPVPFQAAPETALETILDGLVGDPKTSEAKFVRIYLCGQPDCQWPTPTEAAKLAQVPLKPKTLLNRRQKWQDSSTLKELGEELETVLQELGLVASIPETCDSLLSRCGSINSDPAQRSQVAQGVLRALLEVEDMSSRPRFCLARLGRAAIVCRDLDLAQRLEEAAQLADQLVSENPLPSYQRILQELTQCAAWNDATATNLAASKGAREARLSRIVTSLAHNARLSSRGEFYPKGMPLSQSLPLVRGVMSGKSLKLKEINELILNRYPEAQPIDCSEDELDALLKQAQAPIKWNEREQKFCPVQSSTTSQTRASSVSASAEGPVLDQLIVRLQESLKSGEPQVLKVRRSQVAQAEQWLSNHFNLATVSLEERLLQQMDKIATADDIKAEELSAADHPQSNDWPHLKSLASEAADQVIGELEDGVVLKRFSLWARYDLLGKVAKLVEDGGRCRPPKTRWLMTPYTDGLPTIDGQPLPLPPATRPLEWNATAWRATLE